MKLFANEKREALEAVFAEAARELGKTPAYGDAEARATLKAALNFEETRVYMHQELMLAAKRLLAAQARHFET